MWALVIWCFRNDPPFEWQEAPMSSNVNVEIIGQIIYSSCRSTFPIFEPMVHQRAQIPCIPISSRSAHVTHSIVYENGTRCWSIPHFCCVFFHHLRLFPCCAGASHNMSIKPLVFHVRLVSNERRVHGPGILQLLTISPIEL